MQWLWQGIFSTQDENAIYTSGLHFWLFCLDWRAGGIVRLFACFADLILRAVYAGWLWLLAENCPTY